MGLIESVKMTLYDTVRYLCRDLPSIDVTLIDKDITSADAILASGNASRSDVFSQMALTCSAKALVDPDWSLLAGRILMVAIHEIVPETFSKAMKMMESILNPRFTSFVEENAELLNAMVVLENDMNFDIFAVSTLRKSYLAHLKVDGTSKLMECPQYMYLRVATFLWYPDFRRIQRTYTDMSEGNYCHASPTLFNAGLKKSQMSSCYLMTIPDTMESISKSWHDCAIISMNSGGIGCDYSQLRHSEIGQHGFSRGIVPWLKIKNEILKTVDQGGKRKGSGTMFLRDMHIDVFEFISMRDEGPEDMRAPDLFYAIMVSDLFMKRVRDDQIWSLFCPNKAKGLFDKYGTEFEEVYTAYENEKLYSSQVKARDLWKHIILMQIKKGMPFIAYMDAINNKSNQRHSGVIRCSNLCVAGDTRILTDSGYHSISDLTGQTVMVWNGHEYSKCVIEHTGSNRDLLHVELSNGVYIDCTPEHHFYIYDAPGSEKTIRVSAKDLKRGDRLINYELPPYPTDAEGGWHRSDIDPPIHEAYYRRVSWLIQYCEENATYDYNNRCLFITSDRGREHLLSIRLLLQTFGADSVLVTDGSYYKLKIDMHTLMHLNNGKGSAHSNLIMGIWLLPRNLEVYGYDDYSLRPREPITVVSVTPGLRGVDTFCFTEPHRHMGMFNGVLLGQCMEIAEVTSATAIASCNLASIALNKCVEYDANRKPFFNFGKLERLTGDLVRNINQVIDRNYYPADIPEVESTNMYHRPMGIGVQGLADTFALLDISWVEPNPESTSDEWEDQYRTSESARLLNRQIFETMYYSAVRESMRVSREDGPYDAFEGSPMSRGQFQFDLWSNSSEGDLWSNSSEGSTSVYSKETWNELRQNVLAYGVRNSLLIALMPTASSAHILSNNECFEPFTELIYARTVLSGQFMIINKHMVRDLKMIGMWNTDTVRTIISDRGSMKNLSLPQNDSNRERLAYLKMKYRTVFEIPQKVIVDLSADRGPFICQTQSLNCHMAEPTFRKMNSYHFYAWQKGLKTGMYYLRQKALSDPINFAVNSITIPTKSKKTVVCTDEVCISCQS